MRHSYEPVSFAGQHERCVILNSWSLVRRWPFSASSTAQPRMSAQSLGGSAVSLNGRFSFGLSWLCTSQLWVVFSLFIITKGLWSGKYISLIQKTGNVLEAVKTVELSQHKSFRGINHFLLTIYRDQNWAQKQFFFLFSVILKQYCFYLHSSIFQKETSNPWPNLNQCQSFQTWRLIFSLKKWPPKCLS